MKYSIYLVFLLFSYNLLAQNSILSNKNTLNKIEFGLDSLYNFQFDFAENTYTDLEKEYSDHPLPPLFNSIIIYWKHFPLTPASPYHEIYISNITTAINKSDQLLDQDKNNTEALFMGLMARLLLMQYYADNHESSKVIPYVRKAYKAAKKGFDLDDQISDFKFTTGLYNYYRQAYPEKHPVYKPIAYFFPEGNKKLGLKLLEDNWHNGIFLDTESLSFLVYINLNFEGNFKKSARYTGALHKSYPNNPLFLLYRIRSLLLLEKYNKALPLIHELEDQYASNKFFAIMSYIYKGIYEEKKNHNNALAENYYHEAIRLSESYEPFINSRISYAYFGLSRIWENKDHEKALFYRKKATELSSYSHLNFD